MRQQLDLGPIEISYAAALRGVVPRPIGQAFRYVRCGAMDVQEMIGLAASNPEGEFVFILANPAEARAAQERAYAMRLANLAFLGLSLDELTAAIADRTQTIAPADYCCIDLTGIHDPARHQVALQLAGKLVAPGGLFTVRYAPFAAPGDGLRFMVSEFAPELKPEQQLEFLQELKQLGYAALEGCPAQATALAQALAAQQPEIFLRDFGAPPSAPPAALTTIAALSPQQFGFVGDAAAAANYLEMTVPAPAQDLLYSLRDHLLYEIIKDFAAARAWRTDIWVKQPAELSDNLAKLFGNFFYGLADSTKPLPPSIPVNGKDIDLTAPVVTALFDLMRVMPVTIGDFLSHDIGREFKPTDVVMAVQLLTACGVAAPMRGSFGGMGQADAHDPRLAGQYNQQLRGVTLEGAEAMLASTVAGRPLRLRLQEALVLQAVDRVGFEESADALMEELLRISGNPAQARLIFTADTRPAPDFAENMIREICANHMVGWYALGILDAA